MMRVSLTILLLCAAHPALPEVELRGIDGELATNVRNYVGLFGEDCSAEPWLLRRRFAAADKETREALQPFGYYAPAVASKLDLDGECWKADIQVDPGAAVKWRALDIRIEGAGGSDNELRRTLDSSPLRVGRRLRHAEYEQLKRMLQTRALERGYVDAEFVAQRLDVWPDELAAAATLHFDSGERYVLGEIHYENGHLTPDLIEAYLDLESGTAYDGAEISRAYRDLSSSGYFSRVQVTPDFDGAANRQIPIQVALDAAQRIEYTVGVGFATDTGPRLRGGYRNLRVNRHGHRLRTDLTVSPVISGLTAEYRQPIGDPRSDWMSYTAAIDVEDTETAESEAIRVGVRRTRQVSRRWLRTLSIDYSYDQFTVADQDDISRLLLPAVAFEFKQGSGDLYPDRAFRFNVEVRGAHESLGSNTSVLQAVLRARWIRATSENGRLLARAALGGTVRDDFAELPPSLRFFAGGDDSVRGYGYNTLGPSDEEGEVIGGSALAVASLEYEHRIRGNFFGAMFLDAGNAYDDDEFEPAYGAGLGVKWRSPVGPIGLYLAHPFNQSNQDVRVHVSLGVEL